MKDVVVSDDPVLGEWSLLHAEAPEKYSHWYKQELNHCLCIRKDKRITW